MIPVQKKPEPDNFDVDVRKPGLAYIHANPNTPASKLPAYWRKVLRYAWEQYGGICAYLAVYIDFPTGGVSIDHFVPKSKDKSLVYEWDNYRLSSLGANRDKGSYENILDPFTIKADTFILNLLDGDIQPNSTLSEEQKQQCKYTIKCLGLDDPCVNQMRCNHITEYLRGNVSADYLKQTSPFVYAELLRQGFIDENKGKGVWE